ncbi:hypothetical protein LB527_00235 [Mesorhizobium sp. CA3]|uniref:hypothetical protein n=1 Tax=Mesorhizobium sp. CA3 TaxID=2876639 RepID=UPI001CCC4BDC|nr:hypothetical protein [Mesorhizobium sp. CA3]MBZ9835099.1 hypothetical protein [Mesorhizobium sp. CA3]
MKYRQGSRIRLKKNEWLPHARYLSDECQRDGRAGNGGQEKVCPRIGFLDGGRPRRLQHEMFGREALQGLIAGFVLARRHWMPSTRCLEMTRLCDGP